MLKYIGEDAPAYPEESVPGPNVHVVAPESLEVRVDTSSMVAKLRMAADGQQQNARATPDARIAAAQASTYNSLSAAQNDVNQGQPPRAETTPRARRLGHMTSHTPQRHFSAAVRRR
jgi:hypothetical protein